MREVKIENLYIHPVLLSKITEISDIEIRIDVSVIFVGCLLLVGVMKNIK